MQRTTEATPRLTQNSLKIPTGRHPEASKIDPSTVPEHPRSKEKHMVAQSWRKSRESRPKVAPKWPIWDPSGTPKSTKKRPGAKKALPKMAPEAFVIDFLHHLRSKSHSRSILGGSEPPKWPVWDPSGTPKSTKKRPGAKKAIPKTAPEAVFIDFLHHLRSKSHSRSILGGSEP